MPPPSQKGKAPGPGPDPAIQPVGSSEALYMMAREKTASTMAMTSSATRMTILPFPVGAGLFTARSIH